VILVLDKNHYCLLRTFLIQKVHLMKVFDVNFDSLSSRWVQDSEFSHVMTHLFLGIVLAIYIKEVLLGFLPLEGFPG
jgi:hypothetical protein